jgi:hypothetical protein
MLFKEIIPVSLRIIQDPQIQNAQLLIVKTGGTYSSHRALRDKLSSTSVRSNINHQVPLRAVIPYVFIELG